MERLTNSIDFCQMHCDFGKTGGCFFKDKSHCYDNNIYNRLREYEIAEEQGLLIKLPCEEGTPIWIVGYSRYGKSVVYKATFRIEHLKSYNKGWFLTKEEAEKALKQMGE